MIRGEQVPQDWERSFMVNCYKGKGDALLRGNYRGLKLLDQGMKVCERIINTIIREQVNIDSMQFGFMEGRGTTDDIFILRQLQEEHINAGKNLHFAFVDLEKAFDRVPRQVIWWAMRKLGVQEWLIRWVQSLYRGARSSVRIGDTYSEEFQVKVGVHQGSVLSPLLFITVLEVLSREFRTGCPWELFYADDLVIMSKTLNELLEKLKTWKKGMEAKGLKANMTKTKLMISGPELNLLRDSGKYPCAVCRKGVGSNAIYCTGCAHWVHKRCSGIKGTLANSTDFQSKRCKGIARPIDGRPTTSISVEESELEVMSSATSEIWSTLEEAAASIARTKAAWGKFKQLLPLLTSRALPLNIRGKVYKSCVRSVVLHGSETWAPTKDTTDRLVRNDRAMLHWMYNTKPNQEVSKQELMEKFNIAPLENMLRANGLSWYGHVERSSGWINRSPAPKGLADPSGRFY